MIEQYENFFDIAIRLSDKGGAFLSINNNSGYIDVHVESEGYKDWPNNVSGDINIKHLKDFSKAFENLSQYLYKCSNNPSISTNQQFPRSVVLMSHAPFSGSFDFCPKEHSEILKEIYKTIKEVLEMNNIKIPEFLLTSNN